MRGARAFAGQSLALKQLLRRYIVAVTADLEDGYRLTAEQLVERLLEAGACGFNVLDTVHGPKSMIEPDRQADRSG